jgi:23S rRNA pseudouridine955/2504/2580 synthase/23S rRNA pseudouridine1911/1915/1917 synthase
VKTQKAYKLLAVQEKISNRAAKELIDNGLVYFRGQKVTLAREELPVAASFRIEKIQKPKIIYEDENLLVVDKPAFMLSEQLSKSYGYELLHRLDKETSGVLMLVKNEEYKKRAIEEFKKQRVQKVYLAVVGKRFVEPLEINAPIATTKTKGMAYSKVAPQGKEAHTLVEPFLVEGKHALVKVTIKTGRTHQIRVHLSYAGFPIVGDSKYGGKSADRIFLHAYSVNIFDYTFKSPLPQAFSGFGFYAKSIEV